MRFRGIHLRVTSWRVPWLLFSRMSLKIIFLTHWSLGDLDIGIDTNIEVVDVSLTTWEAHHSPWVKPEGCGELPRSLMRQQWPKLRYQFLFYHDETKLMMNKRMLSIKMLKIVPKKSPGYSMVTCAHLGVRWPDCFYLVTCIATTVMSK